MRVAFLANDIREPFKDYGAPVPYFNPGVEALLEGFAAFPEIEVHLVSCTQQPVKAPEKLADRVWCHNLHVPKLGWLRTGYQGCIRAVRRKINELKPDLAHAYGTERDCAISAIFSGVPNLVTIQGNMAEIARLFGARFGSFHWLTARLENFTLRRTAGVICNSKYTEELVRLRARRTWVVYPALRPVFLTPVAPGPAGTRPCVLLNVGVISTRKRQWELLGVAEALHRQGLKFEFHFIGRTAPDDDYSKKFLDRIKPMEAAGYARYLGRLPMDELIRSYNTAAGMVHFSSEEAFGLNVAEALARELKFFGSRLGGIAEIAEGVPGAELFAQDDWTGLTRAMARWIGQGYPRPEGAAACMRERFHPEIAARRHVEIYRAVAESGR